MVNFRYFGTDGIRGRVGENPITADFILHLGWAIGKVMQESGNGKNVVIGKDTRISGYMFESALLAGLVASGTDILLSGPLSTPAIAYLTQTFHASAGIVISASHNSYKDNGIKIFDPKGEKIDNSTQEKIEQYLDEPIVTVTPDKLGKASRITDASGRYIEYCKRSISRNTLLYGYRIVVDCANGATYNTAPKIFEELGAEVIPLGINPDGFNINKTCGSTYPENAAEAVKKFRANFAVVLDGDGDRLVMVDHKGEILDGDDLLYILANNWSQENTLGKGVVGTHMTNMGLQDFCESKGIKFKRVPVGDRNIVIELKKNNWLLGGETSGHIICPNFSTTGDGIVAALQVISILAKQEKSLHEIKQGLQRYSQKITNIPCHENSIINENDINLIAQKFEKEIGSKGRIFIRKSGTEPLLRVLVEAKDNAIVDEISENIAKEIRETLNKANL